MQRFALANFCYSTNGVNRDPGGWLDSKNECDWNVNQVLCAPKCIPSPELSAVEQIQIFGANLSCRIPIEIGLLTQLTGLGLYVNELTGSLPSELGPLITQQLTWLDIPDNELTGSLPSKLGRLT